MVELISARCSMRCDRVASREASRRRYLRRSRTAPATMVRPSSSCPVTVTPSRRYRQRYGARIRQAGDCAA